MPDSINGVENANEKTKSPLPGESLSLPTISMPNRSFQYQVEGS